MKKVWGGRSEDSCLLEDVTEVHRRARDHMGLWNRILEKQLGTVELNCSAVWQCDNLTAPLFPCLMKIGPSACELMLDHSSNYLLPSSIVSDSGISLAFQLQNSPYKYACI
jgi:hypothetical protein